MNQPKLSDLYTCQLLKLYYRLYRNKLPRYFDNFLPVFGIHNHTLRNDLRGGGKPLGGGPKKSVKGDTHIFLGQALKYAYRGVGGW